MSAAPAFAGVPRARCPFVSFMPLRMAMEKFQIPNSRQAARTRTNGDLLVEVGDE